MPKPPTSPAPPGGRQARAGVGTLRARRLPRAQWVAIAALSVLEAAVLVSACGGTRTRSGGSSPATAPASSSSSSAPPTTDAATTTSSQPTGKVVVVAGDIACAPGTPVSPEQCQQAATADLAASLHPDAVIAAGDLQYEVGGRSAFEASYGPTWGGLRDLTHPAAGNHEYGTTSASGYFSYWGDRAGAAGKGWYSWDLGGWHLIALNSNCSVVGCGPGSEQLTWLTADLAASSAKCTLAYWHHPRWSSGLHGDDTSVEPLWQALVAAHADVVVSGHDHDYERFAPRDGVRQFVAGTGGRNLYPVLIRDPGSEAVDVSFGVLRLVLGPTSYSWEFHPLGGGVADSGTTACG